MTKAVAVIHDDIWVDAVALLPYDKAGPVTVQHRDAEWEQGFDEEGVPYMRFIQNGEPYDVDVATQGGGYVEVGMIGNWHIVMLASKGANLLAINQLSVSKVLGLAVITTDAGGNVTGWDAILDEADRLKISTWMENNDYGAIPEGATARQAVRLVWRVINAELDENSVDIAE